MVRVGKRRKNRNPMRRRKWEDLDRDVLERIFSLLKLKELVFTISWVCNSWRSVCWDMMCWKNGETLDFTALKCFRHKYPGDYSDIAVDLMKMLRNLAIDEDKFSRVTTMIFPDQFALADKHLVYLAERSPRLRRLSLMCATKITGRGFSRAIRKWKDIEEISISPLNAVYYVHIFKEVGINCKNLQVLSLSYFSLSLSLAPVLAENLKGLKELKLQNFFLSQLGLQVLFSKCKQLMKVVFRRCTCLDIKPQRNFESWEIMKIIVGSEIKWSYGSEEFSSLKDMLDLQWKLWMQAD